MERRRLLQIVRTQTHQCASCAPRGFIVIVIRPADCQLRNAAADAFHGAMPSDSLPETRGTDNIRSLAMVFGAIESAETGRRVAITQEQQ